MPNNQSMPKNTSSDSSSYAKRQALVSRKGASFAAPAGVRARTSLVSACASAGPRVGDAIC